MPVVADVNHHNHPALFCNVTCNARNVMPDPELSLIKCW